MSPYKWLQLTMTLVALEDKRTHIPWGSGMQACQLLSGPTPCLITHSLIFCLFNKYLLSMCRTLQIPTWPRGARRGQGSWFQGSVMRYVAEMETGKATGRESGLLDWSLGDYRFNLWAILTQWIFPLIDTLFSLSSQNTALSWFSWCLVSCSSLVSFVGSFSPPRPLNVTVFQILVLALLLFPTSPPQW